MAHDGSLIEEHMTRAIAGDETARHALLDLYRDDLRRMVDARMDRRLSVRVDASDVVQDALVDAWRRMDEYFHDQPLPFLAWLRQIVNERMIDTHRRHVVSQRRGVGREVPAPAITNESAVVIARELYANDTSPSNRLACKEFHAQLSDAISSLPETDREILVMRHIEQLDTAQIAEALNITPGAVKARLLRALLKLRQVMGPEQEG